MTQTEHPSELTANPYQEGNYAPVTEEVTVTALETRGSLPGELDGLLLRNGTNPFGDIPPTQHWFTGAGMVHGLRLRDGRAEWYANRWIRTADLDDKGGPAAVDPSPVRDRLMLQGSGAVNVMAQAGHILALGEVGFPYELDGVETLAQYDFDQELPAGFTAHPKVDATTGEMFAFAYNFGPEFLWSYVIDSSGALVSAEPIDIPGLTMMHDMGLTATRVVYMDLPVTFDGDKLAVPGAMPFTWHPEAGARVGVLPRGGDSDSVRWIELDPCYVFHTVNAWDEGATVVMDVARYPTMFSDSAVGPDRRASLWRWHIDPDAGALREEQLDDRQIEFPRIDERRLGLPYSKAWAVEQPSDHAFDTAATVVYDDAGKMLARRDWDGAPSEGVFAARSAGADIDDGWLLTVVYDPGTHRSRVHVADAATLEDQAVVELPVRVPFGFHGAWVPAGSGPMGQPR